MPLARSDDERNMRAWISSGLKAVHGGDVVRHYFAQHEKMKLRTTSNRYFIVAVGKAAVAMAKACEEEFLAKCPKAYGDGIVITKDGHVGEAFEKIKVYEAAHPVPDERGVAAARALEHFSTAFQRGDGVYFLLSGGASALLPYPVKGVTLDDKRLLTEKLLAAGADIHEMNTLRRHLSQMKGGKFLRFLKGAQMTTLAISDVPGDEPSSIGSGPTVPDPSTLQDCRTILEKYHWLHHLSPGLDQAFDDVRNETLKSGDALFSLSHFQVVARNRDALSAIAAEAKSVLPHVTTLEHPLVGDVSQVVETILHRGQSMSLQLSGGEPTVKVTGTGKGGRNTELALRVALAMQRIERAKFAFASCATDGTDGPTDSAGAMVDETTISRAKALGLDAEAYLRHQDSYTFFQRLGDLISTGPTSTNVMDIHLFTLYEK